ncbi:MAG: PilT/PilU family type 4a pilus ATPase [Proteobacteria bacterium]|nr:MAG: PilT/PilU family type 4a pilus ATPase [Pseudomonadota bacterium]QKK12282.1 MAG: PilT/PilU family type 4a pilus ATPase [Pseudomonadota bacterium]
MTAARIDAFLQLGREQGCSDIHLAVGMPPILRLHGELTPVRYRELDPDELERLLDEILNDEQRTQFNKGGDLDLSYESEDAGRFRVNLFRKVGGLGATFRVIPEEIPSLESLNLPPVIQKFTDLHQGLVLVTGATGTGKTTTLSSMIHHINQHRKLTIITLEDPIEFVHKSAESLIVQREVGVHVPNFAEGLRAALREDPDIILVGELRDLETVSLALIAAETGHLVLGTLHTTTATKTLDRIIDALPVEQKLQGMTSLSQNLRAVVSQSLVRTPDGRGRKAICEIMVMTPAISHLLMSGKVFQIPSKLQTGRDQGMQLLDQALLEAVQSKQIDPDDAYRHAVDKKQFQRFVTDPTLLPTVNLVGQ